MLCAQGDHATTAVAVCHLCSIMKCQVAVLSGWELLERQAIIACGVFEDLGEQLLIKQVGAHSLIGFATVRLYSAACDGRQSSGVYTSCQPRHMQTGICVTGGQHVSSISAEAYSATLPAHGTGGTT